MIDILGIGGESIFDDRIVKIETHTYNPYADTTFGYSDEIQIPIQQQDQYTLPCENFLYVEGRLTENAPADAAPESTARMANNVVAFLFDEIRYELDGMEIDRSRNVGIAATIKNYISLTSDRSRRLQNAEWNTYCDTRIGDFNFACPSIHFLGFCEDYKRVVINARHELVLIARTTITIASRRKRTEMPGSPC